MSAKRKLQIAQLDKKLASYKELGNYPIPQKGWIFTIRNSLNMSLKQFGKRLGITPQSAKEIKNREMNRNITLKRLAESAEVFDMKLVYVIVPKGKSLESIIAEKALKVAKDIVLRTSHSMSLEDQENVPERIKKAIEEKTEELKNEIPRYLWD